MHTSDIATPTREGRPEQKQDRRSRNLAFALLRPLVALVVSVLSLLSIGGTASAWQVTAPQGRTGAVSVTQTQYTGSAYFNVGGLLIHRNGAVSLGFPQQLRVRADLQYWRNGQWVVADSISEGVVIPTGRDLGLSSGYGMTPRMNGIGAWTGYYRVAYYISWGGGYSVGVDTPSTGGAWVLPSTTSDVRCGTLCRAYANYVQVL